MLSPRLTDCPECANILSLLKKIDCKLAELGNNLYNNISYMLNKPVPADDITQLIGYRRILMYKLVNPSYVQDYSINMISSKVIRLTVGCVSKCNTPEPCIEESCDITIVPNPSTTTSTTAIPTTTTSSSSTSTTTSTSTTLVPTTTTTSSSSTSTSTSTSTSSSTSTSTSSTTSTTTTAVPTTTTSSSSSTSTSTSTSSSTSTSTSTTTAAPTTTTTTTAGSGVYAFEFYEPGSTTAVACGSSILVFLWYSNVPTLTIGSPLYTSAALTTLVNGANYWFRDSVLNIVFQINAGYVVNQFNC